MAATKTKSSSKSSTSKASASDAPAAEKPPAKVPTPFADHTTAADALPSPHQFVRVTKDKHEGRYGVVLEAANDTEVVVRTRDADHMRIVVKYADLEVAEAGGR